MHLFRQQKQQLCQLQIDIALMSGHVPLAEPNLAQSQLIKDSPYADVIAELNQLKPLLVSELQSLSQKHQILLEEVKILQKQQKQQPDSTAQNQTSEPPAAKQQDPLHKKQKQLRQVTSAISAKQKQVRTLNLRHELLSLGKSLGAISPMRLQHFERIFNHYCQYIFKSGKHVTFDRIEYQKSHLIMQRFFAFIHDFQINKYHDATKGEKELIPKNQLILAFKKSSANSRNLELTEFISCVQRFAVLKHQFEQSYEERKVKEEQERKRIKEINLRRQKQRERRKLQKDLYEEKVKQEELRKAAEEEEKRKKQLEANQQQQQEGGAEEVKEETKEQRKQRKKREKEKKKKKKDGKAENESETNELAKSEHTNENNNDEMLNELMQKDSSIQNPNEEFNHLKKFNKPSKTNLLNHLANEPQETKTEQLLTVSREQKVELLYRAIELDNLKAVEAKLREYEKPLFKEKASERKSSIMLNSSSMSKIKQTDHDHKLKLNQLKNQIQSKHKQIHQLSISRAINDQKYAIKKKEDYERYLVKSIAITNNDTDALEQRKSQNKKKPEPVQLSLDLLNQSSDTELHSLKLGHNLRKYFQPEEDDSVFLKEYGGGEKIRSSNSSYLEKTPRYSVDMKKRVNELEEQEKRKEEEKLERFALQMYKNQHYMKRFLERKF